MPQLARALLVTVTLAGCSARQAAPRIPAPSVIVRAPVYLDSVGVAGGTGEVRVAVRAVPRPTEGLGEALVTLLDNRGVIVARRSSTSTGLAVFPRVPAGEYRVRVQRIGYEVLTVVVPLTAGCAADVEAYLAMMFIGLDEVVVDTSRGGDPKPGTGAPGGTLRVMRGRATITVCAGDV